MIGFYYVIIKGYEEIYLRLPEKFQNWAFMIFQMLMYFVFYTCYECCSSAERNCSMILQYSD